MREIRGEVEDEDVSAHRLSIFWKVSGIVAGFVVTVLCLSRRTVLHTCHARMLPA